MRKFNSSLVNVVAAIFQDGTDADEQGTNLAIHASQSKAVSDMTNQLNYFLFCHFCSTRTVEFNPDTHRTCVCVSCLLRCHVLRLRWMVWNG